MPIRRRGSARDAYAFPTACAYVGPFSRYANPFRPGDPGASLMREPMDESEVVSLFAATLLGPVGRCYAEQFASALRGLDLMCTCPLDRPCHADVLMKLANCCGPSNASVDPLTESLREFQSSRTEPWP